MNRSLCSLESHTTEIKYPPSVGPATCDLCPSGSPSGGCTAVSIASYCSSVPFGQKCVIRYVMVRVPSVGVFAHPTPRRPQGIDPKKSPTRCTLAVSRRAQQPPPQPLDRRLRRRATAAASRAVGESPGGVSPPGQELRRSSTSLAGGLLGLRWALGVVRFKWEVESVSRRSVVVGAAVVLGLLGSAGSAAAQKLPVLYNGLVGYAHVSPTPVHRALTIGVVSRPARIRDLWSWSTEHSRTCPIVGRHHSALRVTDEVDLPCVRRCHHFVDELRELPRRGRDRPGGVGSQPVAASIGTVIQSEHAIAVVGQQRR